MRDVERVREGRGERPGVPRPQLARAQVEAVEPRLLVSRWRRFFSQGTRRRAMGDDGDAASMGPWSRASRDPQRRRPVQPSSRSDGASCARSLARSALTATQPPRLSRGLSRSLSFRSRASAGVAASASQTARTPAEPSLLDPRSSDRSRCLCENQIFNPTSMCAQSNNLDQTLRLCFENSMRAIDPSKNQPNRLRIDRAREFQSLVGTSQTSG